MLTPQITFKTLSLSLLLLLFSSIAYAKIPSDLSSVYIVDCKTTDALSLNSYYLYSKQPVFNAHTNALKRIEFLLRKISKIKKRFKQNSPQQHAFYIPVSFEPQSWVQQPLEDDFAAAARWVLHNYDFQCAKKLLNRYDKTNNKGPYIFSSLKAIQVKSTNSSTPFKRSPWKVPTLVQDFSYISEERSTDWLNLFFRKSWQPKQWQVMDLLNLHHNLAEELNQQDLLKGDEQQRIKSEAEEIKVVPLTRVPAAISPCMSYPVNSFIAPPVNRYLNKIRIQFTR